MIDNCVTVLLQQNFVQQQTFYFKISKPLVALYFLSESGNNMSSAFLIFLAVVLIGQGSGQQTNIGSCNLTTFTGGGQKCQRDMITELQNNTNTNCSNEHKKESTCLSDHVNSCVKDDQLFNAVKDEISKLLLLLLYHCGNLNFNVKEINPFTLNVVQCNADELNKIVNCWDGFRSTFQANTSDPSLCRKYAEAKQNCVNIAREACGGICLYVSKDEYNPFCSDHTDPPGTSVLFDCIRNLGCSEKFVYEEANKCEKLAFKDFADGSQDCSTELKKNMDCLKNNLVSKCPAMKQKAAIFDDVLKSLRANLMTQRFFCNKVDLNLSLLHRSAKAIANCKPEFFAAAEECAAPFRKTYTEESAKKSEKVCKAFSATKKCLNNEHKKSCDFDDDTQKAATFDDYNPFCESGKDPQESGAGSARAKAATLFLFVYTAVYFVL